MITVFVNEDGYYISGEGNEISRRFSPALTDKGDRIFPILHHTYSILYFSLREIRCKSIEQDVMVYHDTRIIDEINGYISPLDDTHKKWLEAIHRVAIPEIRSIVLFHKRPSASINKTIQDAHERMLGKLNPEEIDQLIKTEQSIQNARKQRIVDKFRRQYGER